MTQEHPDTVRLRFLMNDGCIDGFVNVPFDRYDFAMQEAERGGREEPNADDDFNGFRLLLDAAMQAQ